MLANLRAVKTKHTDTNMPHIHHKNPWRLLELIWTMAFFNMRSEVQRSYLSYGWWILEPLLHMVVYYIVFDKLLHRGGEGFVVFLLTGLVPWMWFLKAVNTSSGSILSSSRLMLQVGLPSIVFPLVAIMQATLKLIPVFILLLCLMWLNGYSPNIHWLALIPVLIIQALLVIACACTIAAIIPFLRDLSYLVPTGLTFLMFLSGIFYDYRNISPKWQELFLMNPVAYLLKSYREILIDSATPDFQRLMIIGVVSGVTCLLLLLLYKRLRFIYPRIATE